MDVHDPRTIVDFQRFTFSGHLRSHVYKVLEENIKLGHADYACYWALELLCSGIVHSMWSTFFDSAVSHINRAAPNSLLYLLKMYEKFAAYEANYSIMSMTDMRNNKEVRILVCEVAASLATCRKHKLPSRPRIKPEHDFQQITIQENLKSPSANYARPLVKSEDPFEIYVPFNEFVYCLRQESRDLSRALYWVSWILCYASQYKKQNKNVLNCAFRPNPYVDDKFARNVVWLLWDAAIQSSKMTPIEPYVDALFKFHCLRWNYGVLKSRICFLTNAIQLICESNTLDIHYSVPHNITAIHDLVENIPQWISAIVMTQRTFSQ
jgi:hypothetical protein